MDAPWRIELLGSLRAACGDRVVTRFRARKTGVLLAYLALTHSVGTRLHRAHPREALIDLLWPEADLDSGRNNLSRELNSLRHQLEPPGVPAGAVIIADRASVRLNPATVTTDVIAFEAALQSAGRSKRAIERAQWLADAGALYRGELLPGIHEDWILPERQRLAEAYLQALGQLVTHHEQGGDLAGAIQWARRALAADPLREEAHDALIRLLAAAGQSMAALRQYQELERLLARELDAAPAPEIRALARDIRRRNTVAPDRPAATAASPLSTFDPTAAARGAPAADRGSPPTGTVTFLVVGIGDGAVLEACRERLRPVFRAHGGEPLPAVGEMLPLAFARASDALAAALAAPEALEGCGQGEGEGGRPQGSSPASSRAQLGMALHTGEAHPGEDLHDSPAFQFATRLLLAAHPGQILVSEKSAVLLRDHLPPGLQLIDCGLYRLQDRATPGRLFLVQRPGMARRHFPPPRALPAHEGCLPVSFTRFFGREDEIARLHQWLLDPETRMVTLTGPGGSGKTRLALEVAGRLREPFQGAVWFVPLQELTDPRLIASRMVDVLRLPRSPHVEPLELVAAFLSHQHSLLLLDNVEHLVRQGAPLVQTLRERMPTVTLMVTSRQRLGLPGEQEFPLLPLPVPAASSQPTAAGRAPDAGPVLSTGHWPLATVPSVQLFVDRAQAVRPDFQLTTRNAEAVARLCERLEGLPLALELAAARIAVLTPRQMLARLEHRFELLVSPRQATDRRHRSLRAALEWSYQLLAPEQQRFFARLSVFRGGWSLDAAEMICDEPSALELLEQLRAGSLVATWPDENQVRFSFLETLREYAAEQLAPVEKSDVCRRHARYFLALAEEAAPKLRGGERREWLQRLEREHDNLRASLAWGLSQAAGEDRAVGCRLAVALSWFWDFLGFWNEGRRWLEQAMADAPANGDRWSRARALYSTGVLAFGEGEYAAAQAALDESLALWRTLNDPRDLAAALMHQGLLAIEQRDSARARPLLAESVALLRQGGDQWQTALALCYLGSAALEMGDRAAAGSLYKESRSLFQETGDPWGLGRPVFGLGRLALARGDYAAAPSLFEEAASLRREASDISGVSMALLWLGTALRANGDDERAAVAYEECLAIRRKLGNKRDVGWVLNSLGILCMDHGDYERAAAHFEESLALFRELGARGECANEIHSLGEVARRRGNLSRARALFGESLAQFRELGPGHVGGIEECLDSMAAVAAAEGRPERAARLLGAEQSLRDARGARRAPCHQSARDQQLKSLRQALGETAFAAAWATGQAMTLRQAVADALTLAVPDAAQ